MTDYPEYTLTRPPNCPAKWDHLKGQVDRHAEKYQPVLRYLREYPPSWARLGRFTGI